jgi:hypothetical protein
MPQPDSTGRSRARGGQQVSPSRLGGAASRITEEEARLALLQAELAAIQGAIRGLDGTDFQIKGWCVTASLAIGGFAAAYHKAALLVVAFGAVGGFYLVNWQFKAIQRVFIRRNHEIDDELRKIGIIAFLKGAGNLEIVGTAAPQWDRNFGGQWRDRARREFFKLLHELISPNVFGLYLFILTCLIAEVVILS